MQASVCCIKASDKANSVATGSLGPFVAFVTSLFSVPDPIKQLIQQEFTVGFTLQPLCKHTGVVLDPPFAPFSSQDDQA